jgi:hypothetical protein
MALLEELKRKQRELGDTNEAFAQRLTVSKVHWIGVKTERRPLGPSVKLGALRAFPDLQEVALDGGEAGRQTEALAAS